MSERTQITIKRCDEITDFYEKIKCKKLDCKKNNL